MAEQPVNLSTVLYLGVFSRAEQRVLQAIFKAIAEGSGKCFVTLETLARDSNTSRSTTRNAIAQAVAIGLLEKTERRFYCTVSRPNILTYGKALTAPHLKATHDASPLPRRIALHADRLNREPALRFSEPNGLG
jgi:DNA-binding IclR family transcriptional regulator